MGCPLGGGGGGAAPWAEVAAQARRLRFSLLAPPNQLTCLPPSTLPPFIICFCPNVCTCVLRFLLHAVAAGVGR